MTCNDVLKAENKPYPRTCADHGLGPCPLSMATLTITNRPGNGYEEYEGRPGVWMLYGYTNALEAPYISGTLIDVVQKHTKDYSHYKIGFWPLGMDLRDAVAWWESLVKDD